MGSCSVEAEIESSAGFVESTVGEVLSLECGVSLRIFVLSDFAFPECDVLGPSSAVIAWNRKVQGV